MAGIGGSSDLTPGLGLSRDTLLHEGPSCLLYSSSVSPVTVMMGVESHNSVVIRALKVGDRSHIQLESTKPLD